MENNTTIILTPDEKDIIKYYFFEALYNPVHNRLEEKGLQVIRRKLHNVPYTYYIVPDEEIEITPYDFMKAAEKVVKANFTIYEKYLKYVCKIGKRTNILKKLLLSTLDDIDISEEAITEQFTRKQFTVPIIEKVLEFLNFNEMPFDMYDQIRKGKILLSRYKKMSVKNIISLAYRCYDSDIDEFIDYIERESEMEQFDDDMLKSEFIYNYFRLTPKKRYILYKYFDDLKNPFSFFNAVSTQLNCLNKRGFKAFNDILELVFPDETFETILAKYDNLPQEEKRDDYLKVKNLIDQVESIIHLSPKNVSNLFKVEEEQVKSYIKERLNHYAPMDYEIFFVNLKVLFNENKDDIKAALYFTTLTEKEKDMFNTLISLMNSIPEYQKRKNKNRL